MGAVDYKALKKGGFMKQVQKNFFSMRLKSVGGQLTVEQLRKITEVAETYGQGYIHLTSRQGVEIPFIKLEDIAEVKRELEAAGVFIGACGPRVRTVTACQGKAICPSGLIETTELAKDIDARYFGKELPHKFKIGITGCRNNCLKAEENDVGIKGATIPEWNQSQCIYCGLCEGICPEQAISMDKEAYKLRRETERCKFCGKCIKACPTNAWMGQEGYIVYFGGRFGNSILLGRKILPIILSTEELFVVLDAALAFFTEYGQPGERFSSTIERTGWDRLQQRVKGALQ